MGTVKADTIKQVMVSNLEYTFRSDFESYLEPHSNGLVTHLNKKLLKLKQEDMNGKMKWINSKEWLSLEKPSSLAKISSKE